MKPSYQLAYAAAWIVAAVGVVAGVLAGSSATPYHPGWLTPDLTATAGLVSAACVGLAALLPQLPRTPTVRANRYLNAAAGVLPDDLQASYPGVKP